MHPQVDDYLLEGCGRCSHYQTPQCKVHTWAKELKLLRRIVLDCGLREDYKWSQPCYTFQGKNILLVTAFKDHACLAFFKGVLFQDQNKVLTAAGAHSQSARQWRFTHVDQIIEQQDLIKAYIYEAIELEKAGRKVKFRQETETPPAELLEKMQKDPQFKAAFEALTTGRQRGYILHFLQAKQSKTRMARIEKYVPQILKGEGLHDAYRKRKS